MHNKSNKPHSHSGIDMESHRTLDESTTSKEMQHSLSELERKILESKAKVNKSLKIFGIF